MADSIVIEPSFMTAFGDQPELPEIPVIDIGAAGADEMVRRLPDQTRAMLAVAQSRYPRALISWLDRRCAGWLARTDNPLQAEIGAVAAAIADLDGGPGAHAFNLAHLWGCTAAVGPTRSEAEGMLLSRTLDWPIPGLGAAVIVARMRGPAGPFDAITWPGYAGVLSGVAKGRFAITLNQAPLPGPRPLFPLQWAASRAGVFRRPGLAPEHAIRHALASLDHYDQVVRYLAEVPLCMPVIFSVAGVETGSGCVIERRRAGPGQTATVRRIPAPTAIANRWIGDGKEEGIPFSFNSTERLAGMRSALGGDTGDETQEPAPLRAEWLTPPVLCRNTRLAMELEPGSGRLWLCGFENQKPSTRPLAL